MQNKKQLEIKPDGLEQGRFYFNDKNELCFEGNIATSAEIFLSYINKSLTYPNMTNEQIKEMFTILKTLVNISPGYAIALDNARSLIKEIESQNEGNNVNSNT